jgi:hypothetical protein
MTHFDVWGNWLISQNSKTRFTQKTTADYLIDFKNIITNEHGPLKIFDPKPKT